MGKKFLFGGTNTDSMDYDPGSDSEFNELDLLKSPYKSSSMNSLPTSKKDSLISPVKGQNNSLELSKPAILSSVKETLDKEKKATSKETENVTLASDKIIDLEDQDIEFTSDAELLEVNDEDRTVTLIGFVDEILLSRTVGNNKKFTLFKFYLNNGQNSRMEILCWNELAELFEKNIHRNQKLIVEQLRAKAVAQTSYRKNHNSSAFEFNVQKNTSFSRFGEFDPNAFTDGEVMEVSWDELGIAKPGFIIFRGFLKSSFKNTATYEVGQGVLGTPQGKVDVEVRMYAEGCLEWAERGENLIVAGRIAYRGDTAYITVANPSGITKDIGRPEKTPMSIVFKNNATPRRPKQF